MYVELNMAIANDKIRGERRQAASAFSTGYMGFRGA